MLAILKRQNGMDIVGQGGKIILFTLPSLAAAILLATYAPRIAALPQALGFLKYPGIVLLVPGLVMWATAIGQLVNGFPKGKLVTTGAYGVVRNPIYSSAAFFILPGIALLTLYWVYLVPSVFLYAGVLIFIRSEERQLTRVFGQEYLNYLATVDRLIPFVKP
ncbi:MAG: methyltransferase family protein [Anaerolineae bacterium]